MGKVKGAPFIEQEDGWTTVQREKLKKTEGMVLKSISVECTPGEMVRIRTVTRQGKSHDATVWNFKSNGIPKQFSLNGHEFGGHEIKEVLIQVTDKKAVKKVEFAFDRHGG